jgi:hypothetical protein
MLYIFGDGISKSFQNNREEHDSNSKALGTLNPNL